MQMETATAEENVSQQSVLKWAEDKVKCELESSGISEK